MHAIRGEASGLRRASRRSCRYAASSGRLNQTCRMTRLFADDRNCPRPSHPNGVRTIPPGVRHTRTRSRGSVHLGIAEVPDRNVAKLRAKDLEIHGVDANRVFFPISLAIRLNSRQKIGEI